MSSLINISILALVFLLSLAIPVLIGVFVYNDSKKRNMNAVLWTLIVVLAPTFIGLIIYLIVRDDHSPLQCPSCSQTVTDRYTVCPKCGAKLKLTCEKCSFPVEPQWHLCPNCAEPLPENQTNPLQAPRNDKGLVGILIAVILIPVFLCVSLVIGFSYLHAGSEPTDSSSMYTDSLDKTELCKVDEVNSWLSNCDQTGDGIYVLACESKEDATQSYLIYRKGAAKTADIQTNSRLEGFFRKPVNIFAYSDLDESDADGYDLCYLIFYEKTTELKITENGTDAAYSMTRSDTNWPELISEYIYKDFSGPVSIEIQNNTDNPIYSIGMDIYHNGEISETNVVTNANNSAIKNGGKVSFTIDPSSFNDADSLDYDLTLSDSDNNIIFKNKFTADANTNYQFLIDYDANGNVTLVPVN